MLCSLHQVALRLSDLHIRLKKLGHTEYLPNLVTKFLPCYLTGEEANDEVCPVVVCT